MKIEFFFIIWALFKKLLGYIINIDAVQGSPAIGIIIINFSIYFPISLVT